MMKIKSLIAVVAFAGLASAHTAGAEPQNLLPDSGDEQELQAAVSVQNNMNFGGLRVQSGTAAFDFDYDAGHDRKFELTATEERKIAPLLSVFAGARAHQKGEPDFDGLRGMAGVRATLPRGIDLGAAIDHRGHALFELGRESRPVKRLSLGFRANSEREFRANVNYEITRKLAVTAGYDTTHGKGVGLKFSS